jgi:hypothetical protein
LLLEFPIRPDFARAFSALLESQGRAEPAPRKRAGPAGGLACLGLAVVDLGLIDTADRRAAIARRRLCRLSLKFSKIKE